MNEISDTKQESPNIGKFIAFALLLLILGTIIYFSPQIKKEINQNNKMQENPSLTKVSSIGVSITQNGFSPQTIQIKKGQSVIFTNTDTSPHQVASDPHPTHTNLPGFDSQEALLTNESYVFIFEKTGTFAYHDMHIVLVSDETGEIHADYYQGWSLADYDVLSRHQSLPCAGIEAYLCPTCFLKKPLVITRLQERVIERKLRAWSDALVVVQFLATHTQRHQVSC